MLAAQAVILHTDWVFTVPVAHSPPEHVVSALSPSNTQLLPLRLTRLFEASAEQGVIFVLMGSMEIPGELPTSKLQPFTALVKDDWRVQILSTSGLSQAELNG